jgi:hypothetical protein
VLGEVLRQRAGELAQVGQPAPGLGQAGQHRTEAFLGCRVLCVGPEPGAEAAGAEQDGEELTGSGRRVMQDEQP